MPPSIKILVALLLAHFAFLSSSLAIGPQTYIPEKYKGIITYAPEPELPVIAQGNNTMMGQGIYRLKINEKTGTVDEIGTLLRSGYSQFDAAAVWSLFKWKFRPGAIKQLDVPVSFGRDVRVDLRKSASR